KSGTGTLVLAGPATHTGGTTVSAGTLQIGAGGTTGSIAGNITDNATVAFNRSDALTYSGVLSGSGALTKDGAGTLHLNRIRLGNLAINAGNVHILASGGSTASTSVLSAAPTI